MKLIAAILAASKKNNSGDVNINVPATDNKDLISALGNQNKTNSTGTPATNIYNQGATAEELATLLGFKGQSELEPVTENSITAMDAFEMYVKFEELKSIWSSSGSQLENLVSQPTITSQPEVFNPRKLNVAITVAMLLLMVAFAVVRKLPTAAISNLQGG